MRTVLAATAELPLKRRSVDGSRSFCFGRSKRSQLGQKILEERRPFRELRESTAPHRRVRISAIGISVFVVCQRVCSLVCVCVKKCRSVCALCACPGRYRCCCWCCCATATRATKAKVLFGARVAIGVYELAHTRPPSPRID